MKNVYLYVYTPFSMYKSRTLGVIYYTDIILMVILHFSRLDCKLESDVLPECKQYHSVVVSSVSGPDLFFIQRKEKLDEYVCFNNYLTKTRLFNQIVAFHGISGCHRGDVPVGVQ